MYGLIECNINWRTIAPDVFVFDKSKHSSKPNGTDSKPDLRLKGHSKEGYGLAWNPLTEGTALLTCYASHIACGMLRQRLK
jgi:histone-binding protein RBBP4